MPTNIPNYNGAIKVNDLTIEQKTLIQKEIFNRIKPKVGTWAGRVSRINVPKPYKTATFRTITYRLPKPVEELVLKEGVIPDPVNGVIVSERTIGVETLGAWKPYTDELANYSFDDMVRENVDDLANQTSGSIDNDVAKLYTMGTQVYTAASGLTREILIKIRIALRKMAQSADATVYAVMTPEDVSSLRLKYNKEGANLFQDLPANGDSVLDGKLHKFEGIIIQEDDNIALYPDEGATKRYAIFYVKDSKGRFPVSGSNVDNLEFINKPLGSAGTSDPLNQEGSMGVKVYGYGNMITAEECLIKAEITIGDNDIDTVESGYTFTDDSINANGTLIKNKNYDGSAAVVETSPAAMTVSATATKLSLGGTKTATLSAKDVKGASVTGFTATSADTSKVTVSGTTVTGVAKGEVKVTVSKAGYNSETITFTVVD